MPGLQWDKSVLRYRAPDGRFVSRVAVVEARQSIVREVTKQVGLVTDQLKDGAISIAEWQAQMRDTIKAGHTLAHGIASGGKRNMTPSDWGKLGAKLKQEYKYLQRWAITVEHGGPISIGRARMYAKSIRQTHQNQERAKHRDAGFTYVTRHLTAKESCPGCIRNAGRRLISEAVPLGQEECLVNCQCFESYERE